VQPLLDIAVPDFDGAPVADTHAHLDMLADPPAAIARAAVAGVRQIATVVNVTEAPERTYLGLDAWLHSARVLLDQAGHRDIELPEVRIIVGIHPHNASLADDAVDERIRAYAKDPRTCAIGEVGLDYYYDHSPREVQREVFARHLALAAEVKLPVCVHLRDAHEDGLEIVRSVGVPPAGFVLHCVTVGPETIEPFLALGAIASFAGPLTFKKGDAIRAAAAAAGTDKVMVETDCPFMSPEPFRGKKNEPALVTFTAARMADVLGISARECAQATTATAASIYGFGDAL